MWVQAVFKPNEYKFSETKEYEFPEPKEYEFPKPKEYEFPEPKEYEFPEPQKRSLKNLEMFKKLAGGNLCKMLGKSERYKNKETGR